MSTRSAPVPSPRTLLLLASALVLVACSAPGGAPPSGTAGGSAEAAAGSPAAGTPDPDRIDHPTGATDVVLRVGEEGGFMMMEAVMARMPSFTLYGDGRVVIAAPTPATGQAGINGAGSNGAPEQVLRQTHLDEGDVQALLRSALVDGQLGIAKAAFPIAVMDLPTTVIQVNAGGVQKTVRAPGLSLDPQPGPDAAVLRSLAALVQRLQAIPTDADYTASASLAILAPTDPVPGTVVAPWPWPALAPAAFATPAPNDPFGSTHHLLTDAEATAVGIANGSAAPPATYAGPDGKAYVVVIRPALPDEAAAAR